jgi:hypothetical protein
VEVEVEVAGYGAEAIAGAEEHIAVRAGADDPEFLISGRPRLLSA